MIGAMSIPFYLLAGLSLFLGGCGSLYLSTDHQEAIAPFEVQQPINVALVLGGGGTKGLAHLGVIQELERAGIRPDLIIGCSAGAIAGAIYADSLEVESMAQNLIHLKRSDLLDFSFLRPLFGLVNGNTLQEHMDRALSVKNFDCLKIPLIVISTDLISGETIELCQGDLSSAIRASCAFPGFFKPAFLYGRYLVDGGASNPVPVSVAKKYGAKVIIAVDVSEKLPTAGPKHLFGITKRSLEIAYRKFVEQSVNEADIVIQMDFENVGTFSDHLNAQIFEHGRQALLKKLPEIQQKLQTNSDNTL
jgi:NTE family protein